MGWFNFYQERALKLDKDQELSKIRVESYEICGFEHQNLSNVGVDSPRQHASKNDMQYLDGSILMGDE